MNIAEALAILRNYETQENVAIIEAIELLSSDKLFLTDTEYHEVHDLLWRIAWTNRFLAHTPHDSLNPGLVADRCKSMFYYDGSKDAVLAVLKASEDGRL